VLFAIGISPGQAKTGDELFWEENLHAASGNASMHSSCLAFFPFKFWWGGGWVGDDYFSFFPGSYYVPFKFPISSHHILNMFSKFSMYFPPYSL
jgi:hypothetical protein